MEHSTKVCGMPNKGTEKSLVVRKSVLGVSDLVCHKPGCMVRGLKFRMKEVEGFYYLCSENKGTTAKLICVFVSAYAKSWFSHNEAHMYHARLQTLQKLIVAKI